MKCFVCLLLSLLAPFCFAESPVLPLANEPAEQNQSSPLPPPRSNLEKTLDEAEKKLKSSIEGDRLAAAKLLGKYPNARGTYLLLVGLDDDSALVRRASIVSLIEHFDSGQPMYDRALTEKIFSKVGDPDVEVRREVSAMIPRLSIGLMRSGVERTVVNGRMVFRSVPANLREDLFKLAVDALLDVDSIVRQNMLKYYSNLRLPIFPETLSALLSDKDTGVLLVALDKVRLHPQDDTVFEKVEQLASHREIGIRTKVVSVARQLGHAHPLYRGVLRKMMMDDSIEIAAQAAVEVARFGEKLPDEVVAKIEAFLLQSHGLSGKVESIFYGLSSLGEDGNRIYKSLTSHASGKLRSQAWQRYLSLTEGWNAPHVWLPALSDRDVDVRSAILVTLRGRLPELGEPEIRTLIDSRYPDVRAFGAESLLSAQPDAVENTFFDLLIDEDNLVRATTLRVLAKLKTQGWEKIHQQSLLDQEYAIQRAAMDGLLINRQEGIAILRDYLSKNSSTKIAQAIRIELQRMRVPLP